MMRGAEKTDLLTTPHFERSEQNNRAAIADVLAVAKPRGILLRPGQYAEHRALLLCLGRAKPRALFWNGSGGSLGKL